MTKMTIVTLLILLIPASYATPIPPNCTLAHAEYAKTGRLVPPMWTCPEGSPTIWRQQLCDNFFNCRYSLGDEKICVDYGPLGCSNITFMDENVPIGHRATPIVPRIYLPNFDCSGPLCANEDDVDLIFKAHLICREMHRLTFQRIALVVNDNNRWSVAVSSSSIKCAGHETTVQECSKQSRPLLVDDCARLLALSCAKNCMREIIIAGESRQNKEEVRTTAGVETYFAPENGTLTSLGYPDYFLPYLDCTWTIKTMDQRRVFALRIVTLNLQEFNVDRSSEGEEDMPCTNSYVELGLGTNGNGTYVKHRLCSENVAGMNFTSFTGSIYLRYVSGQYMGTVTGPKGFAIEYQTIQAAFDDSSSPLSPTIITLISFACIAAVIGFLLGLLYCFNKSKYRAKLEARQRQTEMVYRLHGNDALPILRAPISDGHFRPPVICSTCNEEIKHIDEICAHYARLLEFVTNEKYMDRVKKRASRVRCRSLNSNVTIDIDELITTNQERRKQQKRWRSMDISCISSGKTAPPYDNSLDSTKSYTVQLDASDAFSSGTCLFERGSGKSRSLSIKKFSPQLAVRNAASSIRNFLTAEVVEPAKLSISSWRTPSPRKASTPLQIPSISIGETDTDPAVFTSTAHAFSCSPNGNTLMVPLKFRSA